MHVAASGLEWVIVRPGSLTNGPATGQVRLAAAIPYGDVSRQNVAEVFAQLVDATHVRWSILELTDGETPIGDTLAALRSL